MNKNFLPAFAGVITSVIVILLINNFTVVDDCIEHGGHFDYKTAKCLLASGEVHVASFTHYLVAIYFILGIAIAFGVLRIIKKFLVNQD